MRARQFTAPRPRAIADGTAGTTELEVLAHGQRGKALAILAARGARGPRAAPAEVTRAAAEHCGR